MTSVYIEGCTIPVVAQSDFVLDPCNCTSYYRQVSDSGPSKKLQLCPSGELWNHQSAQCQALATVVGQGICDRVNPWNRCEEATDGHLGASFRGQMLNKCIANGRYDLDAANAIRDGVPGIFLLPDQLQNANIELVAAAFVAGCVITLMIVAMVLTICGLPDIRLPDKLSYKTKSQTKVIRKKRTKLSKRTGKAPPNITEGDNVSVYYEDIDEDEPGGPETTSTVQKSRIVTTTTKIRTIPPAPASHGSPATPNKPSPALKPPSRSPPVPQSTVEAKLALKPSGNSPKLQKSDGATNMQRAKAPLAPPRKKSNAAQQPSFGYIHPK